MVHHNFLGEHSKSKELSGLLSRVYIDFECIVWKSTLIAASRKSRIYLFFLRKTAAASLSCWGTAQNSISSMPTTSLLDSNLAKFFRSFNHLFDEGNDPWTSWSQTLRTTLPHFMEFGSMVNRNPLFRWRTTWSNKSHQNVPLKILRRFKQSIWHVLVTDHRRFVD